MYMTVGAAAAATTIPEHVPNNAQCAAYHRSQTPCDNSERVGSCKTHLLVHVTDN